MGTPDVVRVDVEEGERRESKENTEEQRTKEDQSQGELREQRKHESILLL
jgi:hypothetical protein